MQTLVREEAKRKFMDFLEKKNLRITDQRRVIIDTVFSTEEHFTAEQLLEWAREKDRSVSRATVYRTLPLLTESDLVHEMTSGSRTNSTTPTTPTTRTIIISFVRTAKKSWSLTAIKSSRSRTRLARS